jgi:type III pantothenate kinase
MTPAIPLIAVDIGNARIKLGRFAAAVENGVSGNIAVEPIQTLSLDDDFSNSQAIPAWLGKDADQLHTWCIASVNRPAATRLINWLREQRPTDRVMLLSANDLPLKVQLERPDMVGIDRLVDAVAVNRLGESNRSAVIVDIGTAITVDFVSEEGVFLGGAILPGIRMSAQALHDYTDLLPLLDVDDWVTVPSALGTSTELAMQSGLFWGSVGSIRMLIEQLSSLSGSKPQVFLTGGASPLVAKLLGQDVRHVQNLTLMGIKFATAK